MTRIVSLKLVIPAAAMIFTFLAVSCNKIDKNLATVITAGIMDKTVNSATCGGEVTSEGTSPVTEKGVCISTFASPTTADTKTSDGAGIGVFTSQLNDLSPEIIYHVRAYATNGSGTAYGSEISFTTAAADSGQTYFTDIRDGHEYRAQVIGNQTWMAENLAYLPAVSGSASGSDLLPYYYVYGCDTADVAIAKDSANYTRYGVLYNWPAAMAACPVGWHLPSAADWKELLKTAGISAGGKLKQIGTVRKYKLWEYPNTGATDEFGFGAIPGGQRYSLGVFRYISTHSVFWSAAARTDVDSWAWHLFYDNDRLEEDWFSNGNGFSVRCIKN